MTLDRSHTRRRKRTWRIAIVALLLFALCSATAAAAAAAAEPQKQAPSSPPSSSADASSASAASSPPPQAPSSTGTDPLPPSGSPWSASRRAAAASSVRAMFHHAYSAYLRDAFPHDELKPLSRSFTDSLAELGNAAASAPASRRGSAGQANPSKPYKGFALTLIDSLSTLAVLEDREAFCAGVAWIEQHLNFDVDLRVHVFEATIRMLGGLLSGHLLATDPDRGPALTKDVWYTPLPSSRGAAVPKEKVRFQYRGGLLRLALDLGERMLRAFPLDSMSPPATPNADALREAQAAKAGTTGTTPAPISPTPQSALPFAFVHLQAGVLEGETDETCTACSGTLLLEFGVLSALSEDPRFFNHAYAALQTLWGLRHPTTGLFPATFSRSSGLAIDPVSGIGASLDSWFEYLLKTGLLFDRKSELDRFWQTYVSLNRHLRISAVYNSTDTAVFNEEKAWPAGSEEAKAAAAATAAAKTKKPSTKPQHGAQQPHLSHSHRRPHQHARRHLHASLPSSTGMCPAQLSRDWLIESHFQSGQHAHLQFQSLSSFWPGVLVLAGQVDEARTLHEAAYSVWQSYSALPERFFFANDVLHPSERYYPLRPELSESTYLLYRATRDDLFLDVGERMVRDLNLHARVESGGFAGIANVDPTQNSAGKPSGAGLQQEDRMQSFFLAETLKYLYLLFAPDASSSPSQPHWMHRPHLPHNGASEWLFSTEGHLFPLRRDLQRAFNDDELVWRDARDWGREEARSAAVRRATAAAAAKMGTPVPPLLSSSALPRLPLSSPSPELLSWDSKRRFDLRVAQVGRASALKEIALAGPGAICPQLRRVIEAGTALEPLLTLSQVQQASTPAADAPPPHPLSRLFRFQHGLFHPSLVTEVGYPSQNARDAQRFEQKYSYALSRLLGEETARGGALASAAASTPATGRLPALAYQHPPAAGGSQPFTGKYQRSETVPPVSIRDALLLPRDAGGAEAMGGTVRGSSQSSKLNHMQCPLHSLSLPSNREAPASFWDYDRDWLRFTSKMRADAARIAAYEDWQLAQTTAKLRRKSEGVAQPHSELGAAIKAAPLRGGGGGANTPSVQGDGVPTTGTLLINGQTVPLPPELLQMLQAHAAANVIPSPVGGRGPLAQGSPLSPSQSPNSPLRGDAGSNAIRAGDFSVESEAGAFHVIHAPSSTTLTIRNLATDAVELINERILPADPAEAKSTAAPSTSASGSASAAAPARPRNRVQMLTVDSESYLHAHAVVIRGPVGSACDRITVPGAGGHYGVIPPPELPDDPAQLTLFLGESGPGALDPQALLKKLGQARRAEAGQLTGYIVRADPIQACSSFSPSVSAGLRGRVVFVERGGCTFVDKALAVQAAGGIGMIVWNHFDPNYLFMQGSDQSGREVSIPTVMVDANGGDMIQKCMADAAAAAGAQRGQVSSSPPSQLIVSLRRDSYEPGQTVSVAPAVQYHAGSAAPPSPASPSHSPQHIRFEGGLDHFTLRTMAGWTAEVNYDENAQNYQLKLY